MTSYKEMAMHYLRKAAKAEQVRSHLAYYYRHKAADAFRHQARVDRATKK